VAEDVMAEQMVVEQVVAEQMVAEHVEVEQVVAEEQMVAEDVVADQVVAEHEWLGAQNDRFVVQNLKRKKGPSERITKLKLKKNVVTKDGSRETLENPVTLN